MSPLDCWKSLTIGQSAKCDLSTARNKTPMHKLRIALVLNRFYPEVGGAETNLFFQATELAKHHQVTVFTPQRRANTPAREVINGFTVYRLKDWKNLAGKYPNNRRDTLMGGIFLRILFGHFDLVQAFPAMNRHNMLALMACKLRRIPFVLSVFDLLDYAEIERTTGHVDSAALLNYRPGRLSRWCLHACSHIFAISQREINVLKQFNAQVSYSPVPVRPEEFADSTMDIRQKYGIPQDAMLFLVLGRISRLKGQDLALQAFVNVANAMPGSIMVLVGRNDYEPELDAALKKLAAKHALQQRIRFTGMVAREEVIAFLQQSDLHVIPVRFMNSGAVVVESWAAGTPVLQSDAVDPNLVVDGENGYLFPSEDVDALARKMLEAYQKRPQLPALGKNGKQLVLKHFTYENLIQIYETRYTELLR